MSKSDLKWLDDMGLTLWGGRVAWGLHHGWFRWAPYVVRWAICRAWNVTACAISGHCFYGEPECVHCCAKAK